MIEIAIPGFGSLRLHHLVLDYNGTLAVDGDLLPGVRRRLASLSRNLRVHVLTADTFGTARSALQRVPCVLSVLPARRQDRAKRAYVKKLGDAKTVCIGNGRNDCLMLEAAALGIAVVQKEGAASAAIWAADIAVPEIIDALDLLDKPLRLVASLRS
ncbi:MAG: ATPase P [Betaproteobacteria bacterium]|nr:ATPase P [Betaproteobacteria bacterium]